MLPKTVASPLLQETKMDSNKQGGRFFFLKSRISEEVKEENRNILSNKSNLIEYEEEIGKYVRI